MSTKFSIRTLLRGAGMGLVGLALVYLIGRWGVMVYGSFYSGSRAPYLQLPSATSMTLHWQTTATEQGELRLGTTPGQWTLRVPETGTGKQHGITANGLTPATRYYYAVGTAQQIEYGGDAEHYFETLPLPGSDTALRTVVLGDPGYASPGQAQLRDQIQHWLDQHPRPNRNAFDFLLATGDQAYTSGSNPQYQQNFFIPYSKWLAQVPIWPTYGNHDARRFAYFKIFDLPEHGESGGVASNSENYYSFDNGSLHVVVLDTQDSSMNRFGSMYHWLQRDLEANTRPWLIAVLHHPPYTKGSHDSDRWRDSIGRLTEAREYLVPLLEQHGVDLVLSGHSHMYERSMLIDCHYGKSGTLQPDMILAKNPNSEYSKTGPLHAPHQGTVYAVVGSSAKVDNGPLNHPVMAVSRHEMGALILDINGLRLEGKFMNSQGEITDQFSIRKDLAQPAAARHDCLARTK